MTMPQFDQVARKLAELTRQRVPRPRQRHFGEQTDALLRWGESQIEWLMGAAILAEFEQPGSPSLQVIVECRSCHRIHFSYEHPLQIGAQVPLSGRNRYRADYAIVKIKENIIEKLVVECDGHDYHERTKEQAARDRRRDRWCQQNNISVMRFTGSEIWADPTACALEVFNFASRPL